MASTRKSTKRTARTKRGRAKTTAKKRSAKATSKGRAKAGGTGSTRSTGLKRKAAKGLRAAREGLDRVRQVGEKTWEALRSTTGQVIGDVRDKLSEDPGRDR